MTKTEHREAADWHREAQKAWESDTVNRAEVRAAWIEHCRDMVEFHERWSA